MQPFEHQPGGLPPETPAQQTPPGFLAQLGSMFSGDGEPPAEPDQNAAYKDDKAILDFVEECKKEALDNRWVFERTWWKIILYILNRQWIYYDRKRGQWLDKRMAKWIPRPVTNIVATALQTIKTVFQAVQLQTTARPQSPDQMAVATAETVDRLEPLLAEEHNMKMVMRQFDFWFIALGSAVLQVWWNGEAKTRIDRWEACTQCNGQYRKEELAQQGPMPVCEVCGGAEFEPAEDDYGYPVGDVLKDGAGRTDALSPFEYAYSQAYSNFDDVPFIIRMRWRTKKFCINTYGEDAVKAISWGKMPHERSMQLLRALASQTSESPTPLSYGGDSHGEEGATEYELWHKPTTKYPKGLVARVLGDANPVLVKREEEGLPGPLPYRTQDGEPLFPFAFATFEDLGGRINGRGALENGLYKQDQLNQLDSMAALTEQRMANPVWLEPKGAEVKSFTGEPGLVVKYNPNVAGGTAKPERIAGQNIPNSIFTRREQVIADAEEIFGTYDVLKGAKPTGVEAFAALNLLVERSQSRFGPAMAARGEAYRRWYELVLNIERQFGPEKRVQAVMRPNKSWTFQSFMKADLGGTVDILVEDGSQHPKTALGKRAAIEHGRQLGVLNPADPEQGYEVMREIGIAHLAPSLDASMKGALREQAHFEDYVRQLPPLPPGGTLVAPEARAMVAPRPQLVPAPQPEPGQEPSGDNGDDQGPAPPQLAMVAPPAGDQAAILFPGNPLRVKPWDKHGVHIVQHDIWCQSDEAIRLFEQQPELEELWTLHRQAHQQAMAEEAMQQAALAAGAPAGGNGVGAALALTNSNQNATPTGQPGAGSPQGIPAV